MSEAIHINAPAMETFFVQCINGHSFCFERPAFTDPRGYDIFVRIVKADGFLVSGDEVRIPWEAIVFIACGETARQLQAVAVQNAGARPIFIPPHETGRPN